MSSPTDLAAGVQAVVEALREAASDPQDAVRILISLANFTPTDTTTADAVGVAIGTMRDGLGDLCRRAAVVSLARASATYQPSSYDDAVSLQTSIVALLDDEITIAGDKGDDATYAALRALRVAVITDLTARGADLAPLTTIANNVPVPSLALAYRLYGDTTRRDELVGYANPIHPAFMPISFRALAD